MSYYSLQELENRTVEQISELVKEGFKIDGNKSRSDYNALFKAVLVKKDDEFNHSIIVTFRVLNMLNKYFKHVTVECPGNDKFNQDKFYSYYKVDDNIYTDCLCEL